MTRMAFSKSGLSTPMIMLISFVPWLSMRMLIPLPASALQILADTLELPIQTIKGNYIGSKGAAIGAGIACGVFKDLKEGIDRMVRTGKTYIPRSRYVPIYRKKYEAYESALLNLLTEKQDMLVI